MRKLTLGLAAAAAMVFTATSALATHGQTGNGAPNGSHETLNIIACREVEDPRGGHRRHYCGPTVPRLVNTARQVLPGVACPRPEGRKEYPAIRELLTWHESRSSCAYP